MKQLSQWARRNVKLTWGIIILIHLLLAYVWMAIGIELFDQGIHVPSYVMQLGILLFLLAVLGYPMRRKQKGFFRYSYARQKILDGLLVVAFALMLIPHANHTANLPDTNSISEAVAKPIVLNEDVLKPDRAERKAFRQEIRSNRKQLRKSIRGTLKSLKQESSDGGGFILGLLTIIGAILLLLLVAALSCAVGCSGSGAGALLVLIGGIGLVIFLSILAFRGISKRNRDW